jgi:hypothetical protein
MRTAAAAVLAVVVGGMTLSHEVSAQSAEATLEQGVQAYRELEMESAGWLLRQALADSRLDTRQRITALGYLGAAEVYRDRRDSALAAFTRLLRLEPFHALDPLVFNPDVQSVFAEARARTPMVEVSASRTSFAPGERGLPVRLRANTPHVVVVTVEAVNGVVLDTVFRERVRDRATAYWNASGAPGVRPPVGGFLLGVASLDGRGRVSSRVTLPVHVTRSAENPLSVPAPPQVLPERQPAGPAFMRLGIGLAAATAAYFVTGAVTDDKGPQIALAVVFAAAGAIGFWEVRPGKPLPDNVVANEVARREWEARVAQVQRENQRRTDGGTVTIDVGKVSGPSQ